MSFLQGELQLDELSDLRSTFEACDSDRSGGMDLREWVVVLKLWGVIEDPKSVATELIMTAKEGYSKLGGSTKAEFQALIDSIGMPWGIEDPDVGVMELSFPEFMHLMVSGVRSTARARRPTCVWLTRRLGVIGCGRQGDGLERGSVSHEAVQERMYVAYSLLCCQLSPRRFLTVACGKQMTRPTSMVTESLKKRSSPLPLGHCSLDD